MLFRWMKHKDNRKQYPGIIYDNVRLNTGSICLMLKNFVPGCSTLLYNGFQLSVENNNVGFLRFALLCVLFGSGNSHLIDRNRVNFFSREICLYLV